MSARGYVFVSYAHEDQARVGPEIRWLTERGVDVWFDHHIEAGTDWAEQLAEAIDGAGMVLFFATPVSASSAYCIREISYCLSIDKPFLAVHMEPTPMRGGLQLAIGTQQAILRWNLDQSEYRAKLEEAVHRLLLQERSASDPGAALGTNGAHTPVRRMHWHVPYPRNPQFRGREPLMAALAEALDDDSRPGAIALCGMGGVGKTQIALECAYRHKQQFEVVAWLPAEEPEHLAAEYAALCGVLKLPEAQRSNIQERIDAVRRHLEGSASWLLVFDNAPDPLAVADYMPQFGRGKCVITSRHQLWGKRAVKLSVDVLSPGEARELLRHRGTRGEDASVDALAQELGLLPLALESAASYMEATGRDAESYLELFQKYRDRLLDRSRSDDYPEVLSNTWRLSVRQVAGQAPLAVELFQLLAMLGPDDIPLELLRPGFALLTGSLARLADDELLMDECVAALSQYSLIGSDGGTIRMHRLVQLIARSQLPDAATSAERALLVVDHVFPHSGLEGDMRGESQRLLPHALATIEHARAAGVARATAGNLLRRTGSYLSARGRHLEGREHLAQAVTILEETEETGSRRFARASGNLGLVQYALGETTQAERSLGRSIEVYGELFGEDLHVAQDLIGYAWVLRSLGRLELALAAADRSIRIVDQQLGPYNPLVGMPLAIRARVLWDLNQISEAWAANLAAFALLTSPEMIQHPLVAASFDHVAQVYLDAGDQAQADDCARRAVEIGSSGLGHDHPLIAIAHGIRGAVAASRGEHERAIAQFEKALESRRFGLFLHEDIARRRADLGAIYLARDDIPKVREHLFTAQAEIRNVCGATQRVEGLVRNGLALYHLRTGGLSEAAREIDAALTVLRFYGEDHPVRVAPLLTAAGVAAAQGQAELAERHRARAREIAGRLPKLEQKLGQE